MNLLIAEFSILAVPLFLAESSVSVGPLGIALITLFTSSLALIIPRLFDSRSKAKEVEAARKAKELELEAERLSKEQDWARQDEVAKRVEDTAIQTAAAAQLLLDRQALESLRTAEAARLLLAANERVANSTGATNERLDVIHALVNNEKTQGMYTQLNETRRGLISLREIVSLKEERGKQPSVEALAEIRATEERISKLQADILDREQQQAAIDAKKKTSKLNL